MAIRYVSSLATGSGDGTLGAPWTIAQGFTGTLAGDECRIMADGVYAGLTIPITGEAGASNNYRTFIGANASGTVDGTRAVISGANNNANTNIFGSFTNSTHYTNFKNLTFSEAKQHVFSMAGSSGQIFADGVFTNCVFDSNGGNTSTNAVFNYAGTQATGSSIKFFKCDFLNNANVIIAQNSSATASNNVFESCKFIGTKYTAVIIHLSNIVVNCEFVRNVRSLQPFGLNATAHGNYISGCSFFATTNSGITFTHGSGGGGFGRNTVKNCIFRSNGGFGIEITGADPSISSVNLYNNCFSNNTSGNVNLNSGTVWGEGNVLADPLFVSEVNGSEDLTLQATSPCLNAGMGL